MIHNARLCIYVELCTCIRYNVSLSYSNKKDFFICLQVETSSNCKFDAMLLLAHKLNEEDVMQSLMCVYDAVHPY